MKRYRAVKLCGEWCLFDETANKTVRNTESNMKILAVALNEPPTPCQHVFSLLPISNILECKKCGITGYLE
jgi:hypothetical protein